MLIYRGGVFRPYILSHLLAGIGDVAVTVF